MSLSVMYKFNFELELSVEGLQLAGQALCGTHTLAEWRCPQLRRRSPLNVIA